MAVQTSDYCPKCASVQKGIRVAGGRFVCLSCGSKEDIAEAIRQGDQAAKTAQAGAARTAPEPTRGQRLAALAALSVSGVGVVVGLVLAGFCPRAVADGLLLKSLLPLALVTLVAGLLNHRVPWGLYGALLSVALFGETLWLSFQCSGEARQAEAAQKAEQEALAQADRERQTAAEAAERKDRADQERLQAGERARKEREAAEGKLKKTAAEQERLAAERRKQEEEAREKAAEEAKARLEATAKAKEARAKAVIEARTKATEAAADRKEASRKAQEARDDAARVQELKAWLAGLPQSVAAVYSLAEGSTPGGAPENDYVQLMSLMVGAWTVEDCARNTEIVRAGNVLLSGEVKREKFTLKPEPALELIPQIATVDALLAFHNALIPPALKNTHTAEDAARRERVMASARLSMALRNLASLDQQFKALRVARPTADDLAPLTRLRTDGEKTKTALKSETPVYWKAVNEVRGALIERELLRQALAACKTRLLGLGVPAEKLGETATPDKKAAAPTQEKTPVIVYKLKDGRQIRAVVTVEMGDQLSLKDESGKIESVPKTDIVGTAKESP
jgi:hypothetical protein